MIQIQQQIDSVIMGLKQRGALSEVRFVRGYGTEKIETPVRGMLAVVSINPRKRLFRRQTFILGFGRAVQRKSRDLRLCSRKRKRHGLVGRCKRAFVKP